MLVHDSGMQQLLRQIVNGFTKDPHLQEDLLQECRVCLWRAECERPGRTKSWYLQHCRFRVQHLLALGRSVDSPKRAAADKRIPLETAEDEALAQSHHTNGELLETVSFRDLLAALSRHLNPRARAILHGLAEGRSLREVALRQDLSYPTALKYRRRIALVATRLGLLADPVPERSLIAGEYHALTGPERQEKPSGAFSGHLADGLLAPNEGLTASSASQ